MPAPQQSAPRVPMMTRLLAASATRRTDGTWLTHSGAVVRTFIPGLANDQDIDLVIDLATLTVAAPEIPALSDHWLPVGKWAAVAIAPAEITGKLQLLETPPESHGLHPFDEARALRLSLAQDMPWQASIGAKPGPDGGYERITTALSINGRTVEPGDRPMYVLRGGVLTEMSIVLFGADDQTMRVAASQSPLRNLEPTMSEKPIKERLAALTARFGAPRRERLAVLLAEGCSDEDTAEKMTDEIAAGKDTELADLKGKLEAVTVENASLKEQLAALKPAETTQPTGGVQQSATPKTLVAAQLAAVGQDGKPMRGFAALRAARAAHPTLPEA